MAKMRVHELAKELNIKPQEIMDKLKGTAYEVKTSSNSIGEDVQELIRRAFSGKKEEAPRETVTKENKKENTMKENAPEEDKPAGGLTVDFLAGHGFL